MRKPETNWDETTKELVQGDRVAVAKASHASFVISALMCVALVTSPSSVIAQDASGAEVAADSILPNDSDFDQLWALHNEGQVDGRPFADIDAPEAWKTQTGDPTLVVVVIDTGVDYTHQDLAANMWRNPGEIEGNGIDDDGNGYVDDIHGINCHAAVPRINNDPMPQQWQGSWKHGTRVAGTIGAVGDNGVGIAGINWDVQIMALRFTGGGGTALANCIQYAIDMRDRGVNVRVINISMIFSANDALRDSIQDAGDAGILTVAGAGNTGRDLDHPPGWLTNVYPASYPHDTIISVAAVDRFDQLKQDSNYGVAVVDLAAPGEAILSTIPNNRYGRLGGTSMATAHVSGAAALVFAQYPDASPLEVKAMILDAVDPLRSLDGFVLTGGRLNIGNIFSAPEEPVEALEGTRWSGTTQGTLAVELDSGTVVVDAGTDPINLVFDNRQFTCTTPDGEFTGRYAELQQVTKLRLARRVLSAAPGLIQHIEELILEATGWEASDLVVRVRRSARGDARIDDQTGELLAELNYSFVASSRSLRQMAKAHFSVVVAATIDVPSSPVEDLTSCSDPVVDVWEFGVTSGQTVFALVDTIDEATAADLFFELDCAGLELQADDEASCSFFPKRKKDGRVCPATTFVASADATCRIFVASHADSCRDANVAHYSITLELDGAAAPIDLTADDM